MVATQAALPFFDELGVCDKTVPRRRTAPVINLPREAVVDVLRKYFLNPKHQYDYEPWGEFSVHGAYWLDGYPLIWRKRATDLVQNEWLLMDTFAQFVVRHQLQRKPLEALVLLSGKGKLTKSR